MLNDTNNIAKICKGCAHNAICKYVIDVTGLEAAIDDVNHQINVPITSTTLACSARKLATAAK